MKFLGHPIHLVTYVFAVAAFVWGILFDIIGFTLQKNSCFNVSYWLTLIATIASSLVLIFGAVDWICMPRWMRCKAITFGNATTNLLVTFCFCASFLLRENLSRKPSKIGLAYSFLGLTLALVSAWLGSRLLNCLSAQPPTTQADHLGAKWLRVDESDD
jgi:uncharacterized membrane protein